MIHRVLTFFWLNIKWLLVAFISAIGGGFFGLWLMGPRCDGGLCVFGMLLGIPVFLIFFLAGFIHASWKLGEKGTHTEFSIASVVYLFLIYLFYRFLPYLSYELFEGLNTFIPLVYIYAYVASVVVLGTVVFFWRLQQKNKD